MVVLVIIRNREIEKRFEPQIRLFAFIEDSLKKGSCICRFPEEITDHTRIQKSIDIVAVFVSRQSERAISAFEMFELSC